MTKDYLKREPTKYEKYIEYRLQAVEHDLINLQRQISTLARLAKTDPQEFIKGLNDNEAYKKFIEDLNKAYAKFQEANPAAAAQGTQAGEDNPDLDLSKIEQSDNDKTA